MEYILVEYQIKRDVYISEFRVGITNVMFLIEPGQYNIHLGKPHNYEPEAVLVDANDTTAITPLVVTFNPR
jgi:hypothetical protein